MPGACWGNVPADDNNGSHKESDMNIRHALALSVILAFGTSGAALANDDFATFDT